MTSADNREFTISYDLVTKIVSACVVVGLLGVALATQQTLGLAFVSLVLLGTFAYSPRGYIVGERAITVRRLVGNVQVPLEYLREARIGVPEDFRGCLRLWGNGGLFGYYGLYRTSKLGKCTWYLANRKKTVVVIAGAKTCVFSPDDPEGFLAAIQAQAPSWQPSSLQGLQDAGNARTARSNVGVLVGVAVAVAAVGLVVAAIQYSPGVPTYTLSRDALTIHDRFYPVTLQADAVDVGNIRVVDLTQEPDWRPSVRTNGFANQHYQSGWFRLANGKKVRLYRSGSQRMVLLSPRGDAAAVLYGANDPDQFVREVQREWTGR